MKKIYAFLGDYYHSPVEIGACLDKAAAGKAILLEKADLSKIGEIIKSNPDGIIMARENRVAPDVDENQLWLTPEIDELLYNYVNNGGALAVLHAGLASYPLDSAYRQLIRGHFVTHPLEHTMVRYTGDGYDFTVLDEHYFVEVDAKDTQVFLKSHSEHGTFEAGWKHEAGRGKVMCLVPTHRPEGYDHPDTLGLYEQALDFIINKGV